VLWDEPPLAIDGRRASVPDVEPLGPRLPGVRQILVFRTELRRKDHPLLSLVHRAAQRPWHFPHRVEHDPVGVEPRNDIRELLIASGIPRVVVDENSNAMCVEHVGDLRSQPSTTAYPPHRPAPPSQYPLAGESRRKTWNLSATMTASGKKRRTKAR